MVCVLFSVAVWLILATMKGLPVSTTHSCIGGIIGMTVVCKGFKAVNWKGVGMVFSSWIIAPVVSGLLSTFLFVVVRKTILRAANSLQRAFKSYSPIVGFTIGFNIFLIMQFIRGIPRDMDEAAKIDGCSLYGVFFRIIVPMIVPSLVTVGVLTFMGSWEDFMGALLYLNKPATYTVAYALKMFNDSSMSDYGATFAMSTASLVPVLTLFFFFQKNLVEGISIQGLKG